MATTSGNTSSVTLEKEVIHSDDATVRGDTAGGQSTSPLFNAKPEVPVLPVNPDNKVPEYITGIRLHLVLFGVTAVMFLVMLDMTIVVTVSWIPRLLSLMLTVDRQFLVFQMTSTR